MIRYAVVDGQRDARDAYKSVVKVEFSEDGKDFCSGVLLSPYLVLSAAHCFCVKTPPTTAMIIDRRSTRCDMHVSAVRAFFYMPDAGKTEANSDGEKRRERASPPARNSEPLVSRGRMEIEIHPDYRSEYDSTGALRDSRADLVAIHLTEPLYRAVTSFKVPTDEDREVEVGEVLETVGYGKTDPRDGKGLIGERYHGSNIVKVVSSWANPQEQDAKVKDGVFMFMGEGPDGKKAHVNEGDSGGPCFAQRHNERWLVGITSGSGRENTSVAVSLFTSTYVHRKWIGEQKARSEEWIRKLKTKSN